MDLGTGIALLIAFLAVVVLIIRGQSPIIMLLVLAVLWSAIAGIGIDDIQKKVLQAGGVAYASAVIIIVFGAWFAQVLIQTGIAESVIRSAAELAGDRPLLRRSQPAFRRYSESHAIQQSRRRHDALPSG